MCTDPLPGPGPERRLPVPHHPDGPPVVAAAAADLLHFHVDLVAGEPSERDGRGGQRVAGDDEGAIVVVLQRGDGEEGAAAAHEAQLRAVRLPPRRGHLVVVVVGRHDRSTGSNE